MRLFDCVIDPDTKVPSCRAAVRVGDENDVSGREPNGVFHLSSGSAVVTELSLRLAVSFAQILAEMSIVMITVATMTYFERKVLGWMQDRMGPMEVGPYGLLQPVADGIKLFFKEDIVPAGANKAMFALAPMLTMVVSMIGFAVIPFGPNMTMDIFGLTIKPFVVAGHQYRDLVHPGDCLDRRLRHYPGRLGIQQQILTAGRLARRGSGHQLRVERRAGPRRRRCCWQEP